MITNIKLGEVCIEVIKKDIQNLHLSVHPPSGYVRISAPLYMDIDIIHAFAVSKLGWIKNKQRKLRAQERESPREYLDRESHYVWGKRYLLKVTEDHIMSPRVELKHKEINLQVRPDTNDKDKHAVVEAWYRTQLKQSIPTIIAKWEILMGVKVERFFIRRMKTKWGSCNPMSKTIRVNTEVAKKPVECLEYIIIHEMAHLLETKHNHHFIALMDQFIPKWRYYREELNSSPLVYEQWKYEDKE